MSLLHRITSDRAKSLPPSDFFRDKHIHPTETPVTSLLRREGHPKPRLIAELKRRSPSLGVLDQEIPVSRVIERYEPWAAAISVLTEPNHFHGSLDDLRETRTITNKPLLRKDFLTDPIQVREARWAGADFYLLIAGVLSDTQMSEMIHAGEEWNMPALVEVHDEKELEKALRHEIRILGINNRNLHDLTIDLSVTARLTSLIPGELRQNLVVVSESGISGPEDLEGIGYTDAVLIGSAFMRHPDPEGLLHQMFGS